MKKFQSVFLVALVVREISNSKGADWSYDDHHGNTGPGHWKDISPACGGISQSPIDILLSKAQYNGNLQQIIFTGYNEINSNISYLLINNGHTVQLSVTGANLSISSAGLPGRYQLVQFHVHWGGTDSVGSEHKIDGKAYPLEIHFVHYSNRFNNITEALSDPQGLAVLGVFAEIGEKHLALDDIISRFGQVKYKNSNTSSINPFKMSDLLPEKTCEFIRYNGSLTTPKCQESVIWTVLKNPIQISKTQLNAFRSLSHSSNLETTDTPLQDNFRPVQNVGSRTVLRTFAVETTPPTIRPTTKSGTNTIHLNTSGLTIAIVSLLVLFGI